MGRVLEKTSCDYLVLDLSSSKLGPVGKSKHAFLEVEPGQVRTVNNRKVTPADLKKFENNDRIPIRVMPCRCSNRCAIKRLRQKHGNYVDCTIYFI